MSMVLNLTGKKVSIRNSSDTIVEADDKLMSKITKLTKFRSLNEDLVCDKAYRIMNTIRRYLSSNKHLGENAEWSKTGLMYYHILIDVPLFMVNDINELTNGDSKWTEFDGILILYPLYNSNGVIVDYM